MTLTLVNLSTLLNQRTIIKNISLNLQPGVLYGILGPNGSGKSTLLKTMARIWTPSTGQILWKGHDLLQISRKEMSRTISLVPQSPSLYFDLTVHEMVAMGQYPLEAHSNRENEIELALHQVDAWHLRKQWLSQLSGGEKQRIYIARALVTQAPILLLDEPTSFLDLKHQMEIWHLLRSLVIGGKLVIVTVHDLLAARRFCDELIVMHQGSCCAHGSYEHIMTPDMLHEIFGVTSNPLTGSFDLAPHQ